MPEYKFYKTSTTNYGYKSGCIEKCEPKTSFCNTNCNTPIQTQKLFNRDSGLIIEKNLLSVCRIPISNLIEIISDLPSFLGFSQMLLTYEIILINNTDNDINNLSIHDTLAGEAFNSETTPFESEISILSCSESLSLLDEEDIAESDGQLLNIEESSIPAHTTCKIILKLALAAPEDSICEIRHVMNSICVDGEIDGNRINTITEKSEIFKTESDISFLIGVNFNINFDVDI